MNKQDSASKQLIAVARFTYDRRALKPGDEFSAAALDARLLVTHGRARYAEAGSEPEPRRGSKGRYRRRDLRAEDAPQ